MVGEDRDISELFERDADPARGTSFYRARGLGRFRKSVQSADLEYEQVTSESLLSAGMTPRDIDAVVFAIPSPGWAAQDEIQLIEGLHRAGITHRPITALGMHACSGCITALQIARALLDSELDYNAILVLVGGRARGEAARLVAQTGTIFSDGVAAAILTVTGGRFELIATAVQFSLDSVRQFSLAPTQTGVAPASLRSTILGDFRELSKVIRTAYRRGNCEPADIRKMFCTNGSRIYTKLAGEAGGLSPETVYEDDLGLYAHVFNCDNFISLANFSRREGIQLGAAYLLVGWSPGVFTASVLRGSQQ